FSDRGLTLTVNDPAAVASFPAGTLVRGSYGDHSGFCQFESEVAETTAGDTAEAPAVIRLVAPKQITTTQRRRHVRAPVDITIPCALLDARNMTFLSAPGDVANLGGGGLMMIIAAHPSLVVGSKLALAISIPGSDPILALGRTVDVVATPDGPATVRLAFTSIDAGDRERVERFAYRKLGGTAPAKLWASGKITSTQPSPP
ncbi:MAG TPA: PilZ domain-containing protein, partial [Acidimicrobiales bacterium]|nr:PilZ domain-containing protein [Acidimicrobiales bacterium]